MTAVCCEIFKYPRLFGGSAHAFLINIHEQLCPSGPNVWNRGTFYKLLRNLGIEMTDLGFFSAESTPEERGSGRRP